MAARLAGRPTASRAVSCRCRRTSPSPRLGRWLLAVGPTAPRTRVGFREHVNPAYQGLRHIPGNGPYPSRTASTAGLGYWRAPPGCSGRKSDNGKQLVHAEDRRNLVGGRGERSVVFNFCHHRQGWAAWCSTVAQLVNTSSRGTLRLKRVSGEPRFHRETRPSSLRKAVHRTKATGNLEQPRTSSSTGCLADFRRQSVVHCRAWRARTETGLASEAVGIGRRLNRRPWSRRRRHR